MVNLREQLEKEILILDGAMGTAIQNLSLEEKLYLHDERLLNGCHEILNINATDKIKEIHRRYIEAGADIIETNTFNCNTISLKEYGIEELTYKLARKGAEIAKEVAKEYKKKVYIAGSIGPTSKSASIPTKKDPLKREVEFEDLYSAYREQARGLIDGGVDIFLIETIFDGINAKAAVLACEDEARERKIEVPIMISLTVDKGGRVLSGQSIDSVITFLDRRSIISYGLNCSFGAKELIPLIEELSKKTGKYLSIYPNAGLPDSSGRYTEDPKITLDYLKPLFDNKKINIVGGCCGTTYKHIKEIWEYAKGKEPRKKSNLQRSIFTSGNEVVCEGKDFYVVGERCNVAGSRKFKRLISEGKYEEALEISRLQIEAGADIIDVNLDDSLLDSKGEMVKFLRALASDPYTSKVPVMIDSSDLNLIEKALKVVQGKAIVNSISLKEGAEKFLNDASMIKKYGAAVVIMAFDERGQADTYERRIDICERAYNLLIGEGWDPRDIIFDCNILTIGSGREEDRYHGISYIRAIEWIKDNLPNCKTSGGVSNLSFAFRGNNYLRGVIHKIFLDRARRVGLSMAIINPTEEVVDIPKDLYELVDRLILGEDVVDDLLNYSFDGRSLKKKISVEGLEVEDRLKAAIIMGGSSRLIEDLDEALNKYNPLNIIQDILMDGLKEVGDRFEAGEYYLPQIIRSASVMEKSVEYLTPFIDSRKGNKESHKILMCTVRGDVHDIGKNITATVLKCNGYEVIDLGVMVEKEVILEEAKRHGASIVTLSGLISPSLYEMEEVVQYFNENNMDTPILIGGAATSKLHTALKLEPKYSKRVVHVGDASSTVPVVAKLLSNEKNRHIEETMELYDLLVKAYKDKDSKRTPEVIDNKKEEKYYKPKKPKSFDTKYIDISLDEVDDYIDWSIYISAMGVGAKKDEEKLILDARKIIETWKERGVKLKAVYNIYNCSNKDDLLSVEDKRIALIRDEGSRRDSISDFILEDDYIGAFIVTLDNLNKGDIVEGILANAVVEGGSAYLEEHVSKVDWDIALRPAIGYPVLPDHSVKRDVFELLEGEKIGATLTDSYAMEPLSTVCGFYIGNPNSSYIEPKVVSEEQIERVAKIRGIDVSQMKKYISTITKDY